MSHAKGSGGVDGALVSVQNYRRYLLILFADFLFQDVETVVVGCSISVAGKAVRDDFVVEGIQKQRPFVERAFVLNTGHIGDEQRKRTFSIPSAFHKIRKTKALSSGFAVMVSTGFRTDTGVLTAFVRQIIAEQPAGLLSDRCCEPVIAPRFVTFALFQQKCRQIKTIPFISVTYPFV